jgi:hypothetical protein
MISWAPYKNWLPPNIMENSQQVSRLIYSASPKIV